MPHHHRAKVKRLPSRRDLLASSAAVAGADTRATKKEGTEFLQKCSDPEVSVLRFFVPDGGARSADFKLTSV
ncbi:MAG: hypothetical protein H8E44_09830 [Planctomycetes bacterium]|nr:hypothetical protein [Planctomycetota bacterium]MBL7038052.1 hypothetical protein [Pirellulaceae bacterium]